MAFKFSTGLRNALLDTSSVRDSLDGGEIRIYSGTPPSSPNDAVDEDNTLLVTITVDSGDTGLGFEAAADSGTLMKATDETWSGEVEATGTASFFRFVQSDDTGDASTTAQRVQGGVGTGGADMNLATVSLTETETQVIDHFSVSIPE